MVDRLVIRDAELSDAITAVRRSTIDLFAASGEVSTLAEGVGHGRLREAVEGFHSSWSIRRQHLAESLEKIEKHLVTVRDTFERVDDTAAKALREAGVVGGGGAAGSSGSTSSQPAGQGPLAPVPPAPAPFGESGPVGPPPSPGSPGLPDAPLVPGHDTAPPPPGDSVPESDPTAGDDVDLGNGDAINGLLDRLESLVGTPAGAAALAGSVGALTVLLALLCSGSSAVPALGVDVARVLALLDRFTATQTPAAEGDNPGPEGDPIPSVNDQLGDLVDPGAPDEPVDAQEPEPDVPEDAGEAEPEDVPLDQEMIGDESDASGSPLNGEAHAQDDDDTSRQGSPGSPATGEADPQSTGGASDGGAESLAPLPEAPAVPDALSGAGFPATNADFDLAFPDSAEPTVAPGTLMAGHQFSVDGRLASLAGEGVADDSSAWRGGGPAMGSVAGMGAMSAASTAQAVTGGSAGGSAARTDDELAKARRELDAMRDEQRDDEKRASARGES